MYVFFLSEKGDADGITFFGVEFSIEGIAGGGFDVSANGKFDGNIGYGWQFIEFDLAGFTVALCGQDVS